MDRGRSVVLALDLATNTGWALRSANGQIISGTVSFRPWHSIPAVPQLD
jgi:hypothetical protein